MIELPEPRRMPALPPLTFRMRARRARFHLLSAADVRLILAVAGEEIWRSLKRFGQPDQRGVHVLHCTCGDCS